MSDSLMDISLTSDGIYMACGGWEKIVRSYKNNGTSFEIAYQFEINITMYQLALYGDLSRVIAGGPASYGEVYYLSNN